MSAATTLTSEGLQVPHGGKLVDLMVAENQKQELISQATHIVELNDRQACDVELLVVG